MGPWDGVGLAQAETRNAIPRPTAKSFMSTHHRRWQTGVTTLWAANGRSRRRDQSACGNVTQATTAQPAAWP